MSEVDNQALDTNQIEDFIDALAQQNFNQAQAHFEDMLGDKVQDALDQEKLVVADTIFNEFDADEVELDDDEYEYDEDEEVEETGPDEVVPEED